MVAAVGLSSSQLLEALGVRPAMTENMVEIVQALGYFLEMHIFGPCPHLLDQKVDLRRTAVL